jgi:hypothetical protein
MPLLPCKKESASACIVGVRHYTGVDQQLVD